MAHQKWEMWIGGGPMANGVDEFIPSFDPSSENIIAMIPRGGPAHVDLAVQAARDALAGPWSHWHPRRRCRILFDTARALEQQADSFAELETLESGKPLQLSKAEVLGAARYFEYYAGMADKIQGDTIPLGPDYLDFTLREPMGVTAHIVPWNMPLNLLARGLAPAMAAGNTAVVKPSEMTSLTALRLGELLKSVGVPGGVYNVVTGYGPEAGESLCRHPDIAGITFTGSVLTGQKIMKMAADHIKPVVLELGGKSPVIVFADADPAMTAGEVAKGIFANSGQICSAGSRLLVQQSVKDALLENLVERIKSMKVGPGLEKPDMGPLVSEEHLKRVMNYIGMGHQQGASLVTGGQRLGERGYFVAPTVFDRVNPQMSIAQEEIFGPVLSVLTFDEEAEALKLAADVKYGLVAGIFTSNIDRAMRLAKSLPVGQVYVNEYFAGGEETPFGGQKQSGFGREKGLAALENYTQIKNVAIRIRS